MIMIMPLHKGKFTKIRMTTSIKVKHRSFNTLENYYVKYGRRKFIVIILEFSKLYPTVQIEIFQEKF